MSTPLHNLRGLIFDLDGTLVDSLQDVTTAINAALANLQLPRADAAQVRRWLGDGLPMLCRRAAPKIDDATLARLVEEARAAYGVHCLDTTRTFPNLLKTLDLLQARGMRLAVLSNKPHVFTRHIVACLNLVRYFDVVRGSMGDDDRKPSPRGALDIAQQLALRPTEMAIIGDAIVDIETARNAGMGSIAVTWGYRDRDELGAANPDAMVDVPGSIPEKIFLKNLP